MRVAFVTTSFPRFDGDYAGVFVYDLARTLVKHGISVHVLAPHDGDACQQSQMDGVAVTRFPYFFPKRWQSVAYGAGIPTNLRNSWSTRIQLLPFVVNFFARLRPLVSKNDLIHAHWIEPALLSLVWSRLLRRPIVLSIHRFNPQGLFGKLLYKEALSRVDHAAFNSSYTRNRSQQVAQTRSDSIIPPGVDTTRFYSKWDSAQSSSFTDVNEKVILALGSLLPVKGFINLIDAIPLILESTQCHVKIGGQGPEQERLLARARILGVDKHVTFLGRVPTSNVPELMREASVFVLPSVPHESGDNESLGMVLVEAMASGTPCVASHTGGIVDVVNHGTNGFLVTPGRPAELASEIVNLLEAPELRRKMGCAGRRKIEREFALDVVASRLIEVYSQVIENSSGR